MEHLILKSGRYVPRIGAHDAAADTEARVRSLEDHMSRLTEELEHLLALLDEAIARLDAEENAASASTVISETDAAAAVSDGEEGSHEA